MLEVKGLSVSYGQHRALEGASLKIGRGEIVVILGANGAGKSTLLKAVSGICEGRAAGTITMQGKEILGLAPNRIVEEGIALVPEGRGVFGDLTVAENLKLGAHAPRARDEEAGNLDRVLRLFPKLHERRGQIVRTMSGGEQQMVAIGRAMMSNPALLTLDEPSLGLSPLLCKELFHALKAVRDTGIGILLVEQNAKQSLAIADRGYLLENGRIVHEGRAQDLRNDPAVQAAYLGGGGSRPASTPRPTSLLAAPVAAGAAARVHVPPRTTGPSPQDIAAAALAALPAVTPARPVSPAPPPQPLPEPPRMPPPAAVPRPTSPPAPSPTPAMRGTADALLGGLSVGDLVAQASQASRAQYGGSMPAAPPRTYMPNPGTSNGSANRSGLPSPSLAPPPIPATGLGNGQDRLKSVLKEIEDAAARARAWRRDPQ
ncbi:ABC transporter ATP-binding protein [Rhizobium terrae]|uniref:ABC transporter ATP-binding protein n=1 Tax=Rhizobium terrae TaxID=2171756 RepID=UPI000E3DFD78|nr:ABC transporter ATP-binding protein [Rhizobium terrae]